ncbi:hypothetical protein QBC45DRAFT_399674 [Copromyces sp. CBS 386.78]|nr:hypothetical protein QBC45DRAFT_399674 [Copromyces sp. CBS 386.78]
MIVPFTSFFFFAFFFVVCFRQIMMAPSYRDCAHGLRTIPKLRRASFQIRSVSEPELEQRQNSSSTSQIVGYIP